MSDDLTDRLADAIGAMPEAYNVTDYTDEQTTFIEATVDNLAAALLPVVQAYGDERAKEALSGVEALFAGGPDTACSTSWRDNPGMPECSAASIECVEVPLDDLRAAIDAARGGGES